jgi:hypothetical protein
LSAFGKEPAAVRPLQSQFREAAQRKAYHFETLLAVLRVLAHAQELTMPDLPFWLPRAQAGITKAEAILARMRDPN